MFQEPAAESAKRAGRFGETLKKSGDTTKKIQDFAKQEAERKRKKDEEERKKKQAPVSTAPTQSWIQRVYDKYIGSSERK